METKDFKCGFTKCIREGETWTADAGGVQFCPIPYRRETNGQMQVFPLKEVAEHGSSFSAWMEPVAADADVGRGRLGVEHGR